MRWLVKWVGSTVCDTKTIITRIELCVVTWLLRSPPFTKEQRCLLLFITLQSTVCCALDV